MLLEINQNEDSWQQTITAFHKYLGNTVESLAQKPDITKVDRPSKQTLQMAITSSKSKKGIAKETLVPPILPPSLEDLVKEAFEREKTKPYSSPLWVGLGEERSGKSNSKPKRRKNIKR